MTEKSQRIRRLQVSNIKGIKNIEIFPEPNLNEISGRYGQGKSSLIDAIMYALSGRSLPDKPVRIGEKEGVIVVETDDFIIKKKLREEGNPYLLIEGKKGGKFKQGDLDRIWGEFTFDPFKFAEMKLEDQIRTLLELAGKDFGKSVKDIDSEIESKEQERLFAGRRLKEIGEVNLPPKVEAVDVESLLKEQKEIFAFNSKQRNTANLLKENQTRAQSISAERDRLTEKIKEYDKILENLTETAKAFNPLLEKSTEEIDEKLSAASETNSKVAAYHAALDKKNNRDEIDKKHKDSETAIKELREKRRALFTQAKIPLAGLEIMQGGIYINGKPFQQLSSGERIVASAQIGMACSPDLKVMLIRNGSMAGDEGFEIIKKLAKDNDYQIFFETTGEGHGDAIMIEAGEVKGK
jgi:DNA repair ATPase RecN